MQSEHKHQPIEIAIIDRNVLTCLGLRGILLDIVPNIVVRTFSTFLEFMDDTPYMYAHYFVSSAIYFEHSQFFREQQRKTIVLSNGENTPQMNSLLTLNICQDEKKLVKSLLSLRQYGHGGGVMHTVSAPSNSLGLSGREIEVCILLAKGYTNKEVADMLNISLATAISHRKNIMDKLAAQSLADIIIYAVLNGLVDVAEL